MRRVTFSGALMVVVLANGVFAQGTPQTRPPLFLSESWKSAVHASRRSRRVARLAAGCRKPEPATHAARDVRQGDSVRRRPRQRGRLSAQPVDRHDDVAERGDASRSQQLRRPHEPACEDSLGCPHVRLPPGAPRRQARRRHVARGRSSHRAVCRLQRDDISIADLRWMKLDIARVVAVGNWIEQSGPEQGR